jgi:hypothetical protein
MIVTEALAFSAVSTLMMAGPAHPPCSFGRLLRLFSCNLVYIPSTLFLQ